MNNIQHNTMDQNGKKNRKQEIQSVHRILT